MTDPNYFAVIDWAALEGSEFPTVGSPIYIVSFTVRNLAHPNAEPLGCYARHGNRQYLWRERVWGELDMTSSLIRHRIAERLKTACANSNDLRRVLDFLNSYSTALGPTTLDSVDNPLSQNRVFYRVLYELPAARHSPVSTPPG